MTAENKGFTMHPTRPCTYPDCKVTSSLQPDRKWWVCASGHWMEESEGSNRKRELEDSVAQCQVLLARVKRILERMDDG